MSNNMQFSPTFRLGNRMVGQGQSTVIIAEAGVNHGGDINLAIKLVDVAKEAGVDAVKFQAFKTKNLILKSVDKAPYQKKTTKANESQYEMLQQLELHKQHFQILKEYCDEQGLIFLVTPYDNDSLIMLHTLSVVGYKVASTDITNLLFIEAVAKLKKPILLSTGMSTLDDVKAALETIYPHNKEVVLLQCTANYPIEDSESHLAVIQTYKREFDIVVGYSDHTVGVGAAPYAVAMGSKVIEKHYTLDRSLSGPDHKASLDPRQLKQLVKQVRNVEEYLGNETKSLTKSEEQTRQSLQRNLVAARNIKRGSKINVEDITAKRTGGVGIPANEYKSIIGTVAKNDFQIDDIVDQSSRNGVYVVGAGGHARSVLSLLKSNEFETLGIYDKSFLQMVNQKVLQVPIVGAVTDIQEGDLLVLAIGDNVKRSVLYRHFKKQLLVPNVIHATAVVDDRVLLGNSNLIMAKAIINVGATIKFNNILNTGCIVEHETKIGSHNHISVGTVLCGRVTIGNHCFIGANTVIKDGVTVADDINIGAGGVVVRDLLEPGTYVGSPARKIT